MSTKENLEIIGQRFVEAWNTHDMRALGELFLDDAEFVNVYGSWWTGRSRIEAEHVAVHNSVFRQSQLSLLETRAKQLTSEVASLHFRWQLIGLAAPNGASIPDRLGVMVFVLVWKSDRWQIAIAQNTDIVVIKT